MSEGERVEAMSGSPWLGQAYDAFADVRKHLERYSGEEIDMAIDASVTAVRCQDAPHSATEQAE